MKKVFIVHGYMGWPNLGWKSWLMQELASMNIYACSLSMPSTDDPKKEEWVNEIKRIVEREGSEETILVGHSLGVPAILRVLEENNFNFLGIGLVAGAVKQIETASQKTQGVIGRFVDTEFDWGKIRRHFTHAVVVQAKNDDRVPIEHAGILAENLNIQPVVLKTGGHLSDYHLQLTELLVALKEMLKITCTTFTTQRE